MDKSLHRMELMCQQGMPSTETICSFLQGCTKKKDLAAGRQVHFLLVSHGLDSIAVFGDHLIRLFTSCGCLQKANHAFHKVAKPTVYTWNAIISAHSKLGGSDKALDLYDKMQQGGVIPDKFTFLSVLKACGHIGAIGEGRLVHDLVMRNGLELDLVVGNTLLDMYVKCGSLFEGSKLFNRLPTRDVVSWGTMVSGYAQHGHGLLALEIFEKMQHDRVQLNTIIFSLALKSCNSIGSLEIGRLIHGQIVSSGLELGVNIGNHLIDMYSKCKCLQDGFNVLINLPKRDVVSWGTLLSGYVHDGCGYTALELFEKMQQEAIKPDKVILVCTLQACGSVAAIEQGRLVHDSIIRNGFSSDVAVGSTLVDMYVKCRSLEEACKILEESQYRDVVSWGALIAGYAQHGHGLISLELFEKMQLEDLQPDSFIFSCILKACGSIGALGQGQLIHEKIIRIGLEANVMIGTTIIDMYAKCGVLEEAWKVLKELPTQDVVSWNAMIAAYTQHGHFKLAEQCVEDMQLRGLKPDGTTFTSILAACSHFGQVEDGRWYFKAMKEHGIIPSMEHFNCMIDLLGRSGHLNEAAELLQTMPTTPNITGWTSLLSACRKHKNLELGKRCFDQTVQLDPDNAAGYLLMSNIYADDEMWEHVQRLKELRKYAGVWKEPGRAWVESNKKVHHFIAGQKSHPSIDKILKKIQVMRKKMGKEGYVPQLDLVLEWMPDDVKDVLYEQ